MTRYPALARFAAPAGPRSEGWRTALGLVAIVLISWGAVVGTIALIGLAIGPFRLGVLVASLTRAGSPEGLAMLLCTFVPMALAVLVVTRGWHKRSAATLFGPGAGRDFLRVLPMLIGLSLLLFPLMLLDPAIARSNPPLRVLSWLPLALPLLAVQIGAEELVFRGYLLQQLAVRSRLRLVWMVLPSVLFGALHYAPTENGSTALWFALWATGFGCLAADLTARAGNLGPALAFHLANNIAAMFLVGLYGQLDGLALFTLVLDQRNPAAMAPYLAIDSLSMLVFWLLARLALRR